MPFQLEPVEQPVSGPAAGETEIQVAQSDDVVVMGSYQQGGGSSSVSGSASAIPTILQPVTEQQSVEAAVVLNRDFDLATVYVSKFIHTLDAFEEFAFDDLQLMEERCSKLSAFLGGSGGGFHIDGRSVRSDSKSLRPSCLEPEFYNAFSTSQKKDQIRLVKEQKKALDSKLFQIHGRLQALRGHMAIARFKGLRDSLVIPSLKALNMIMQPAHSFQSAGRCGSLAEQRNVLISNSVEFAAYCKK